MADHRTNQEKFPNSKSYSEFRAEISIIELAQKIGYTMNTPWAKSKRSARFPCLENNAGDRIYIKSPLDNQRMRYQNVDVSADEGDLISFVKNRMDTDFSKFRNASGNETACLNAVLYDYLNIPEHVRSEFQKAPQQGNILRDSTSEEMVFNKELFKLTKITDISWLKHRGIEPETLENAYFKDKVYNVQNPLIREGKFIGHVKFINTAFPYQETLNGKIVGLEERNFDFKGHGVNSNKHAGVWVSNPPARIDNVNIVEGALDALSHYQLHKPENTLYFSTGGQLTPDQIQTIQKIAGEAKIHQQTKINLGFDKDKFGATYDLKFIADIAAFKYPVVKSVQDKDYLKISYATASYEQMIGFANLLMEKLKVYNQPVQEEINRTEPIYSQNKKNNEAQDKLTLEQLEKSMFQFKFEKGLFKVEIPKSYYALQEFNHQFLEITGMNKIVNIDKSIGNDWNEDLMEQKHLQKSVQQAGLKETKQEGIKL